LRAGGAPRARAARWALCALLAATVGAQAQTRPWSSDPAVRMRHALEADMNRHAVAANLQSQRVMQSNLNAINARFRAFDSAMADYERERQAQGAQQETPQRSALELMTERADAGDQEALRALAWGYMTGTGLPRDEARAAHWMARAAASGLPDVVAVWGGLLVQGQGVGKDVARGIALVRQSADAGSPRGKGMLGTYYYEGLGVPRDARKAVSLWEEAASAGYHYPAAHNLASVYRNGDKDLPRDGAKARRYALLAAQGGDAEMASLIGRMLLGTEGGPQDLPGALKWLRAAADAGEPVAQTNLAWMLQRGDGQARDMAAAARLYKAAAVSGVANAQFWWGRFVLGGVGGVAQNAVEGAHWLRKAAAQDHAEATLELGRLLLNGFGPVTANRAEALQLMHKASASDAPAVAGQAHTLLGTLNEDGSVGTGKNLAQAVSHYDRAAALKHVEGTARLGLLYAQGIGVAQDSARARALIDSAYASNEPWGLAAMAFLHERGISTPKDLRRGLELYERAVRAGGQEFQGSLERVRKLVNG
jgi:TPR repeat protein